MICFFSSRIVSRSNVCVRTTLFANTFSASTSESPSAYSTTRSIMFGSLSITCWVAAGRFGRTLRAACSISIRFGRSQSSTAEIDFSSSGGIFVIVDSKRTQTKQNDQETHKDRPHHKPQHTHNTQQAQRFLDAPFLGRRDPD